MFESTSTIAQASGSHDRTPPGSPASTRSDHGHSGVRVRPERDRPSYPDRPSSDPPGARVGPRESPTDRADRIERIKRQIATGTYETEQKLDRVINGLIGDLDD
ncbi:MAG: flagellar biosynthesis anti-sigma factor FlgM [Phycisphaerales bacterium]